MKINFTIFLFFLLSKIAFSQINITSFAAKVDYATGTGTSNPQGIIATDLDNDGKKEMIVGNISNSSISLFRNISTSTTIDLAAKVDYIAVNPVNYVNAVDLDGDGKRDLVTSSNSGTSFSVFRNTTSTIGTITFATRQDIIGVSVPASFDTADVDGDNKVDLIYANYGSSNFSIFRNTSTVGTISFATRQDISLAQNPSSITLFDMDGDSKKDIAITYYTASQLVIYRNTTTSIGSPTFALVSTTSTQSYPNFAKYADIDSDGKNDLVFGNYLGNNISVLKNTTTAVNAITFQAAENFSSGTGTSGCQGVVLSDFDNDKKIDIGVCNRINSTISVFKNTTINGIINSSSLSAQVIFSVNINPTDLVASDLNGDGKPEILVSNNGSNNISILRNQIIANEPTFSASNLVFSNSTSTSTTLTFSKGNGSRRIVLAKALSAVNAIPLDSFAYTSKDTFGVGAQIGTGNYVVYNDTGNTVNVKGLTAGTSYYFAVYEYNGTNAYSNYLTSSSLIGNTLLGYSYYSKSSGSLNALSTWGTNPDGTGTSPSSFSTSGASYYVVNNGSPSISADWFITGPNTIVVFGDGTNSSNFSIPSGFSFGTDSFYVNNNFTFTIQGQIYTNKAGFHANSIAQYVLSTPQNIITAAYGNLIISGSTKTILGNVMVKGVLAMFNNINCNGYTLTLGESATQTGTLNRSSGIIIGNFKRWFAATTNTGATGLMPIGTSTIYRPIQVNFTSIPSSGGTLTASFITVTGGNSGFPVFDFTTSPIVQLTKSAAEGYWRLTSDGITGGAYTCVATGTGFSGINSVSDLRLVRRNNASSAWSLAGTSVLGSGTTAIPLASSTGISTIGGEFAIASDSTINPLPVKLTAFNANWKGNDVVLNWQTASELNNSHFEVEKQQSNEWIRIGKVTGKGNTTIITNYSLIDNTILNNYEQNKTLYYRLKQVDLDGKFAYSEIVTLVAEANKTKNVTVFPVPMQHELNVQTTETNETITQIIVSDLSGKEILQTINQTTIDVSKLTQGIYTIKVITDQQIYIEKIVK